MTQQHQESFRKGVDSKKEEEKKIDEDDTWADEDDDAINDEGDEDADHTRYYALLQLSTNCTTEDIQRSYKQLSRVFHPDKSSNAVVVMTSHPTQQKGSHNFSNEAFMKTAAEDTFVELQHCVEVLLDPVLRLAYDVGGVTAVQLVQRSEHQHQTKKDEASTTTSSSYDGANNNDNQNNLFWNIKHAPSHDAAIFVLQQALEEHYHQERQRQERQPHSASRGGGGQFVVSTPLQFDASLYLPYAHWEREASSLSIGMKQPISSQQAITVSASHRLQHRGISHLSGSVGCEYLATSSSDALHAGTTTYAVDARFTNQSSNGSKQRQSGAQVKTINNALSVLPDPYLSFRTTRQLASGTTLIWGLSGKVSDKSTWSYSVSSFRLLQWHRSATNTSTPPSPRKDLALPLKVHAMWRCGWHATSGRLGFLMAQLRTIGAQVTDPQYRLRLALTSHYPIKLAHRSNTTNGNNTNRNQTDSRGTWAISYSIGWRNLWNRIKVTFSQRVGNGGRFTCRYGLKYDGRALMAMAMIPTNGSGGMDHHGAAASTDNLALWTLLFHLHSADWSIRIPIYLSATTSLLPNSAAWMVTILVSQWLEGQLEVWTRTQRQAEARKPKSVAEIEPSAPSHGESGALSSMLMNRVPDVLRHVAAKKRDVEREKDGLVILSVAIDHVPQRDLIDFLQFWVVQSSLNLSTMDILQQQHHPSRSQPDDDDSWWSRILHRLHLRASASREVKVTPRRVDVRYQYQGFVYETFFTSLYDRVSLPNIDADETTQLGRRDQVY